MIRLARAAARARLGGWALGVCELVSRLSGVNALLIRAAFLLGLAFSPAIAISVYAALYALARLTTTAGGGDEERLLEAPFPEDDIARSSLPTELAALERRLAHMEAEALSADALTRARFRSAGL